MLLINIHIRNNFLFVYVNEQHLQTVIIEF